MTVRRYYIGGMGPYLYDDEIDLLDPDADFPGETQSGMMTDGAIKTTRTPVDDEDMLRWVDVGVIVGDVIGPASATDNAIVVFNTTTGKLIKNSTAILLDDGRLGIAITPTALLHIKAGLATAGFGPLKITSGVPLTIPEMGVVEFHDNRFWITNKSVRKAIDRTSDVKLSSTTVENTLVETTVFTADVPANSWVAGNVLKFYLSGIYSNQAAVNDVTIRIKVGGNLAAEFETPGGHYTDECWHINGEAIIRSIGATGEMAYHTDIHVADNTDTTCDIVEIDTTGALDITVTAELDIAHASNIFVCSMGLMEYKN